MKTLHAFSASFAIVFLSLSLAACDATTPQQDNFTYLWLGAVQDAHVTSLIPEANYDGNFSLVTAHGAPNGEQRTYLEIFLPQLPAGSDVLEAYIDRSTVALSLHTGSMKCNSAGRETALKSWNTT